MRLRYLACIAVGVVGGASATASADVSGLAVAPAHPDPADPATRSYFIRTIPPGGSISDQVRVTNGADHPLHLYVTAVDGLTGVTSGAVYGNRQDPVRRWGSWAVPSVSTLAVQPHTTTLVGFTVRVPPGASAGDHLAGLAVEDAQPTTGTGSLQVTTIVRAVVGVLVKVPGPAAFHLAVSGASVQPFSPESRLATIHVQLANDGLLLGKPRVSVGLSGPHGHHDSVTRQLDTILPGDAIDFPFPWPYPLDPGDYTVDVGATGPGMATPVDYHTTSHLGAALQGMAPPHGPSVSSLSPQPPRPSWPLWLLVPVGIGLALLVAVLVLLVLLLRRRPPGHVEQPEG